VLVDGPNNSVKERMMNDLTSDQFIEHDGVLTACASDLGWTVGYLPKVIRINGVFYKLTDSNESTFTYMVVTGRRKVVIFND
jgi:hypothetical protein